MTVLSFDQATLKTGYAYFGEKALEEYGLINLAVKEFKEIDTDTRCRVMTKKICELIEAKKPDIVVIEDVALQSNPKVLIQLSRIQGGILSYCDNHQVAIAILKPSQWRKSCGIKQGKARRAELKEKSQQFIEATFGITMKEDEADATCMGYAVWGQQEEGEKN